MIAAYTEGDEPVPGFRLVKLLAWEAFGSVWRAIGPGGMEAAVKVVSLVNRQRLKEFHALRLVKHIRHPNLVPILAFWLKDRQGNFLDESLVEDADSLLEAPVDLIMVMGLGDKSLHDRLKEHQQEGHPGIPPEELLLYMEDVAQALDHLNRPIHELGAGPVAIQHCDIKPQNVLIVGGAAQVCDLGGARCVESVTQTSAVGSAAYMAPEYITEGRPSRYTDQYSLAVCYVELRTGALPLNARSAAAAYFTHIRGALDLCQLSDPERAVIAKATSVRPDNRYPSCLAMVRALREACGVLPVTIRLEGEKPLTASLNDLADSHPDQVAVGAHDAVGGPPARVEDDLDSSVDLAGELAEGDHTLATDMTFLARVPEIQEKPVELTRTTVVQVRVLESPEDVLSNSEVALDDQPSATRKSSLSKTDLEESWPDTELPPPSTTKLVPKPTVEPDTSPGVADPATGTRPEMAAPASAPAVALRPPSSPQVAAAPGGSTPTVNLAKGRSRLGAARDAWRRHRLPLPATVFASALVGLLAAWLARNPAAETRPDAPETRTATSEVTTAPPAAEPPAVLETVPAPRVTVDQRQSPPELEPTPPEVLPASMAPFVLERSRRPFPTLAAAVAEAADGDTILLQGDGPFAIEPLDVTGKSLTLRAAPGAHPVLQRDPATTSRTWQPLLNSNHSLTLEGIHLRREPTGPRSGAPEPEPLLGCDGGSLHLNHCRLEVPLGCAALLCRNPRQVALRDSTLIAANLGICIEVGKGDSCEVTLLSSSVHITSPHGAALSFWAPEVREATAVHLRLEHNAIAAARIAALKALPQGIDVEARDNDFTFAEAMLSYIDFPAADGWRQATHWLEQDNRYHDSGAWLRINGAIGTVRSVEGWRSLWAGAGEKPGQAQ